MKYFFKNKYVNLVLALLTCYAHYSNFCYQINFDLPSFKTVLTLIMLGREREEAGVEMEALNASSSSSSCTRRVRRVSCSLILKMKVVPPSLPRSSYVALSFWSIL